MNYEDNYKNNLQALKSQNNKLYKKLLNIQENKIFDVLTLKDGVDIFDTRTSELLYNKEPSKNLHDKMIQFDNTYGIMPFTYHFGMGNGAFQYSLLNVRKKTSRVVVIEPEIEILYIALHLNNFAKYILAGNLALYLEEDFTYASAAELFLRIKGPLYYAKLFTLNIHVPYYEKENYDIVSINKHFKEAIVQALYNCGNDPGDTYLGVKQNIGNLKNMIHSPSLKELSSKVQNTKLAVLVATGPSLKKQLPLLEKIQDYVTIFAVDSSFNILYEHNIKADIFVTIERGKATCKLYKNTSKEYFKDTIFAFTSVVYPNIINHVKDGVVSFSTRNYSHIKYFELEDYGTINGGSVANMAYNLITHARFEKCVLIGQDLAFGDDGKTHTAGHIHGELDPTIARDGGETKVVEKYGGNGYVATNTAWNLFKNYYEADISESNKLGIKTFNATEGGARIHGAIELPFHEVVERHVNTSKKKSIIRLAVPSSEFIEKLEKQIEEKTEELVTALHKALTKTKKVAKSIEHITDRINKENAFVKCSNSLMKKVKKLNEEIDALKRELQLGYYDQILNIVLGTTTTHLEIETAVMHSRPMKMQRDVDVFQLQWPSAHRQWVEGAKDAIQHMIYAIGLGILMQKNTPLLEKLFSQEEITFLTNNSTLYDFENDFEYSEEN